MHMNTCIRLAIGAHQWLHTPQPCSQQLGSWHPHFELNITWSISTTVSNFSSNTSPSVMDPPAGFFLHPVLHIPLLECH